MRRAQNDLGSQPVRNLSTNPKYEKNTGVLTNVRQNLCINPRGISTFLHYSGAGAQTITPNVAVTGHPIGLTTATRFTFGPSASNPGINIMSPITASTVYTMSAWVYIESLTSTPGGGGFAENGVVSGTSADNGLVGQWQRITWTRTTTASPGPNFGIRWAAVGGTGTGSILVTGIMIDISGYDSPFFDGASTATGDFTYTWLGTANNSLSREQAPTVSGITATGAAVRPIWQSMDRPAIGSKFLRMAYYSPSAISVALNPIDTIIKGGIARTDLMWIRASRAITATFRYRNPDGSVVSNNGSITLPVNQWTLARVFGSPTGSDDQGLGLFFNAGALVAGDIVDLGPHMAVEGTYLGDFIDGTKPFSKWIGTADQSISIGYPPQLFDIAGKPLFDQTAIGTYILPGGFSNTETRTIYTVYNNLSDITDASNSSLITYGSTALSDAIPNQFITLRQQTFAGADNFLLARRTGGSGAGVGGSKPGVNVAAFGVNASGMLFSAVNNGTVANDSIAMDIPHEKIRIYETSAYNSHVRTLIYRGFHDATTRASVSRYLGNKYGAYIA